MSAEEYNELLNIFTQIDVGKLTLQEQLLFVNATAEMLQKLKPILVKKKMEQALDKPESSTFLFKL